MILISVVFIGVCWDSNRRSSLELSNMAKNQKITIVVKIKKKLGNRVQRVPRKGDMRDI